MLCEGCCYGYKIMVLNQCLCRNKELAGRKKEFNFKTFDKISKKFDSEPELDKSTRL